jgi:hypothetical protein
MRRSAWRGTWEPNKRPYITVAPDAYVSLQGETTVIGCGECQRKVNYNDYITQISTEASVDSPPGSATVQLSIPDNDVNDFYSDGQLLIQPMMEIEIFAKGYYFIGGFPQYYRIFWGVVSSVSKSWSNGVTSVSVSCKDILRWWELTNATTNPAFLEGGGSSAGGYQLFQNQFAGQNPYTTIIQLARDSMGDFFYTTGSFTSFTPEKGPEQPTTGEFMKDIMTYWQLKFANIQASLVLFGTSGQTYTLSGVKGTVSPTQVSEAIFKEEVKLLKQNQSTTLLFSNPKEVATAKVEVARAGDVEFFQNETQSKLSLALHARDQIGYEFYCDTTGDIIFKPPFYNLNVLPNKPVSWIQDFDIIDDQLNDSEAEVVTHVTSSGNAFGGVTDWGLNDEITTPRTGVYDFHLLRRYGWRRADLQLEWAGNPRKLFFHLLDWMDRLNAKRQNGTITIPLRPELRMGFPVWVPKYDSFFYVQGISHSYAVGGQATTTVTLIAKRSKFIAPKNIGEIRKVSGVKRDVTSDKKQNLKGADPVYEVEFPGQLGSTSGLGNEQTVGTPAIIRDPKTGKILGFPNAVMVYTATYSGKDLGRLMETQGKKTVPNQGQADAAGTNRKQIKPLDYKEQVAKTLIEAQEWEKNKLVSRLRAHRYEAGMTNAGAYDYAWDKGRNFRELALIPLNSYKVKSIKDPAVTNSIKSQDAEKPDKDAQKKLIVDQEAVIKEVKAKYDAITVTLTKKQKELADIRQKAGKNWLAVEVSEDTKARTDAITVLREDQKKAADELVAAKNKLAAIKTANPTTTYIPQLNVLIRPVSDEFGFEVIGHYRYGRGAYIDRGKLQIPVDGQGNPTTPQSQQGVANQLSIQFAPTGGFLTDSPSGMSVDGKSENFASLFEQMRPEDYVTGASFTGVAAQADSVSNVQTTSASTYTNLINADKGTGLYIEADATRRAKTLDEMTPTIEIAGLSDAFGSEKCACSLNRANWLSLLPSSLVASVLAPATSEGQDVRYTESEADRMNLEGGANSPFVEAGSIKVNGISREGAKGGGNVLMSPGADSTEVPSFLTNQGFFDALNSFLLEKFQTELQENVRREREYTLGGSENRQETNQFALGDAEQDNILGDPDNPLFQRAALGDPAALESLQKQANFNFGRTTAAIENFGSVVQTQADRGGEALGDLGASAGQLPQPPGAPEVTTGPGQQYQPPAPSVSDPINQRRFDNAGTPVYLGRDGLPLRVP